MFFFKIKAKKIKIFLEKKRYIGYTSVYNIFY